MKKVLMILYSFPPCDNHGADRAVSFVKTLHKYGWEPLVLTCGIGSSKEDKLKSTVPDVIDVVRTKARGTDNLPHYISGFANLFASFLLPDRERLWELFSVRKASRIAKDEGIDLIYTISPPSSAHLIGLKMKKKYPRVPWVADLCSSFLLESACIKSSSPTLLKASLKEHYVKKLLGKIVAFSDCVVTGNNALLEYFNSFINKKCGDNKAYMVHDGKVQELSEIFEKACRAAAAKKLVDGH